MKLNFSFSSFPFLTHARKHACTHTQSKKKQKLTKALHFHLFALQGYMTEFFCADTLSAIQEPAHSRLCASNNEVPLCDDIIAAARQKETCGYGSLTNTTTFGNRPTKLANKSFPLQLRI